MKLIFRNCPLCKYKKYRIIFKQFFSDYIIHTIVLCSKCGFVYVKNLPTEEYYSKYYSNCSVYSITRDRDTHIQEYNFLKNYINANESILDIGCASGNLLNQFKINGYKFLEGIDPDKNCRITAKKNFGINILTRNIKSFKSKKKYDLIILSNVLEHIVDIRKSLKIIISYLKDEGYLFICVPNALNFYKNVIEPFGEFSIEHINFFTSGYISKLVDPLSPIKIKLYKQSIFSIWQKETPLVKNIRQYIQISNKKLNDIKIKIKSLPNQYLIWGAGSLTRRLLATLKIKPYKIIDRNTAFIGKELNGVEIISPESVKKYKQPILICSYRFKNEITDYIRKNFKNKIQFLD